MFLNTTLSLETSSISTSEFQIVSTNFQQYNSTSSSTSEAKTIALSILALISVLVLGLISIIKGTNYYKKRRNFKRNIDRFEAIISELAKQ